MNELYGGEARQLWMSLRWLSNLQFNFAGFFLAVGVFTHAASIVSLTVVIYNSAAIDAILARDLAANPSAQTRQSILALFSAGLLVPALGIVWCIVEQARSGAVSPSAWIVSIGACALGITVADALALARFRASDTSVLSAAMPVLQDTAIFALAVILAGALTATMQSSWPDFVVAIAIVYFHRNAPTMLGQIAAMNLMNHDVRDAAVLQITIKHPRLGILRSPLWDKSTALVRK